MPAGASTAAIACARGVTASRLPNASPKMIERCTPVCTINPGASSEVAT
jgi:hypothetical protein